MSPEVKFNLIVILGALLVTPIARLRYGTWLTSGALYSLGWLFVLVFYHYLNFILEEGYAIPVSSFEFGSRLVLWGYIGVLFGHLFFGPPKLRYKQFVHHFSDIGAFLDKYYLWICGAVFALGMISFLDRLSSVGLSIFTLADLRHEHVNSRFSFFQRFSIYSGLILSIFTVLAAIDDNIREKVNIRRIIAIIVSLLPLALSKASRQEFMAPVLSYGITTFLILQLRMISGLRIQWRLLWAMYAKFLPLFLGLLFVFTVYGQLRSMGSKKMGSNYTLFSLAEAPVELSVSIAGWFASSFYSVGIITDFENVTFPRMHGRIYFEPFFKIPEKLRLIPDKSVLVYLARQEAFREFKTAKVAYTPGTMGKVLTREVGKSLAPYFGGAAMFFAVGLSSRLDRKNIFYFMLVMIFTTQAFMSFQTLRGFNMIVAWQLVFALLFTYYYQKFRVRYRGLR
ncbi:MAG: hypothetical protein ACON39_01810 [Coraliomargaritaceae bacterium]